MIQLTNVISVLSAALTIFTTACLDVSEAYDPTELEAVTEGVEEEQIPDVPEEMSIPPHDHPVTLPSQPDYPYRDPLGTEPKCDDPENPREYTEFERKDTRKRVIEACQNMGGSPITCAYLDAVVVRESGGRAGVWHTSGKGELGVGAMGLSIIWQRFRWPGEDEDPMFCWPEVSMLVALDIMRTAINVYGAKNFLEVQAIYGGRWKAVGQENGPPKLVPDVTQRSIDAICGRLKIRGYDCRADISVDDLGTPTIVDERREIAQELRNINNLERTVEAVGY